jgi:hypothetical protein
MNRSRVFVALLHYPVLNRNRNIITSSITSVDLHDIARSCRTYGVETFYCVTPIEAQRMMVKKIVSHWLEGRSLLDHPRIEAVRTVKVVATLEDAVEDITSNTGKRPVVAVTSARFADGTSDKEIRERIMSGALDAGFLLVFGTGYGLAEEVVRKADIRMKALSCADYSHLSVRSAVAIYLDRLLGIR